MFHIQLKVCRSNINLLEKIELTEKQFLEKRGCVLLM